MGFDVLTALILIVGVVVVQAVGQRPRFAEAMQLTISRLGLALADESRAIGDCRGLSVSLSRIERGAIEIVIAGMPAGVAFARLTPGQRLKAPARPRIGDPDFDAALVISADRHAALGCLGAGVRRQVMRALSRCDALRIEGGALIARVDDGAGLDRAVEALLDAAEALREHREEDIERRLRDNAFDDPCLGVRRRCLAALLTISDAPRPLARRALEDPSPEIRVLGARALGEAGWRALRGDRVVEAALLAAAWDRSLAEETRLAMVEGLGHAGGPRSLRSLKAMSWGLRVSAALREQAVIALRCIEERGGRAEVGAVSLLPLDERHRARGAVTLSDPEAGAISLDPAAGEGGQRERPPRRVES